MVVLALPLGHLRVNLVSDIAAVFLLDKGADLPLDFVVVDEQENWADQVLQG